MAVKQAKRGGTYNKPLRTEAMIEIRRKVIEGESYAKIMRDLRIPERTFFRYLDAVFAHDRQVMKRINEQEVMNQLVILHDRFTNLYQDCRALANNKDIDGIARVKAFQLTADFAIYITRLYAEAPSELIAHKEIPPYNNKNNNNTSTSSPAVGAEPIALPQLQQDEEEDEIVQQKEDDNISTPPKIIIARADEDPASLPLKNWMMDSVIALRTMASSITLTCRL